MKLVFLGPPGAGKGTQAAKLAENFNLKHASTGDIFRAAVASGSDLGNTVKSYLDNGKLVSDDLTAKVVGEMVLDRESDFILDGFPRTIPQAELLDNMLEERGQSLDGVIYFSLDNEDAVERLTGRRVCDNCGRNFHVKFMPPDKEGVCDDCGGSLIVRSDSSLDIVQQRLQEYDAKTKPLIDYYSNKGELKTVDASDSPDTVRAEAEKIISTITDSE